MLALLIMHASCRCAPCARMPCTHTHALPHAHDNAHARESGARALIREASLVARSRGALG
jgi:hypothetical protein